MALRRTVDATTEPVTTIEAKAHLRIVSSAEDAVIAAMIKAARMQVENELGRSLITQTWEKTLDQFPDAIELPYPPVIGVSSLTYYDTAGVQQALDAATYTVDTKSEPGWLVPAYGYDWPDTLEAINAVTVTYTAGYGAAAAVPQAIKQWILMQVGAMFENRESAAQGAAAAQMLPFVAGLLDPYRVLRFG